MRGLGLPLLTCAASAIGTFTWGGRLRGPGFWSRSPVPSRAQTLRGSPLGLARRMKSTWLRAPPEGSTRPPTLYPEKLRLGWGGASARSHGVRKADPEPAPSSGPRLGSPEPPGEPAGPAAFQRPTPVWYDARQQSDSLGRRKAGPCRPSLVQCALSTHAQSLLGNVVPAAFRRWQACLPRSPGQQPSITTRGAGKWSPSLAPASASSRSWMGCTVKRPVGFLGSPRPSKSHPNAKHWKLLRFLEATRAQSPKGKA